VPYQLALRMKFLGFNEPCFGYYESQNEKLVISFNNLPLTEEQSKRPGLYTTDNRNGSLPQWAVAVPLYQQAFRWFREKYSYQSFISPSNELTYLAYDFTLKGFGGYFKSKQFKTYEEAELACLEKLLEIVEEKQK
jgi:hypothetical protein